MLIRHKGVLIDTAEVLQIEARNWSPSLAAFTAAAWRHDSARRSPMAATSSTRSAAP
jgi:hypothetical protein